MNRDTLATLICVLTASCVVVGLPGCHNNSPTAPPPVTAPLNLPRQLTISGNTNVAGPNETSERTATVSYADGWT